MSIATIKDGDTNADIDFNRPFRQPIHINWCDDCKCFRRNHTEHKEQIDNKFQP